MKNNQLIERIRDAQSEVGDRQTSYDQYAGQTFFRKHCGSMVSVGCVIPLSILGILGYAKVVDMEVDSATTLEALAGTAVLIAGYNLYSNLNKKSRLEEAKAVFSVLQREQRTTMDQISELNQIIQELELRIHQLKVDFGIERADENERPFVKDEKEEARQTEQIQLVMIHDQGQAVAERGHKEDVEPAADRPGVLPEEVLLSPRLGSK